MVKAASQDGDGFSLSLKGGTSQETALSNERLNDLTMRKLSFVWTVTAFLCQTVELPTVANCTVINLVERPRVLPHIKKVACF